MSQPLFCHIDCASNAKGTKLVPVSSPDAAMLVARRKQIRSMASLEHFPNVEDFFRVETPEGDETPAELPNLGEPLVRVRPAPGTPPPGPPSRPGDGRPPKGGKGKGKGKGKEPAKPGDAGKEEDEEKQE